MRYDSTNLPTGYDRARSRSPEVLRHWMTQVVSHAPSGSSIRTILDLGCGTGRFSGALQAKFDSTVIGVDPSASMIRQAVRKYDSQLERFVLGSGEHMPLRDASVDLVFISMVLHHFEDVRRVLSECRRVLRGDGFVFLRTGTIDRIRSYPTAEYFPGSISIMERTLSSLGTICQTFESAGFHTSHVGVLEQEIAGTHAAYADQLVAGGDSVLAQLDQPDFDAGVAELRSRASAVDPLPIQEPIDFLVFTKVAPVRDPSREIVSV